MAATVSKPTAAASTAKGLSASTGFCLTWLWPNARSIWMDYFKFNISLTVPVNRNFVPNPIFFIKEIVFREKEISVREVLILSGWDSFNAFYHPFFLRSYWNNMFIPNLWYRQICHTKVLCLLECHLLSTYPVHTVFLPHQLKDTKLRAYYLYHNITC